VGHQRVNELPMRNFFSNKHSPLPYASARLSDAEKFQFFLFGGRFPSAFAPDQLPCIHSLPANVTTRESRNNEVEKQRRTTRNRNLILYETGNRIVNLFGKYFLPPGEFACLQK